MRPFAPAEPTLVISPHLDDGVLSCAMFIHSSSDVTVMTVFAGAPNELHTGYNSRSTGEPFAPDAIAMRREEDADAMSLLSSKFRWLDFFDWDYVVGQPRDDDARAIRQEITRIVRRDRPASVISPLGLFHQDHVLVSDVCLEIAMRGEAEWYLYMDMPYGLAIPKIVGQRLQVVEQQVELEGLEPFSGNADIKLRAMMRYVSQVAPTKQSHRRGFRAAMKSPERYWRVAVAREG